VITKANLDEDMDMPHKGKKGKKEVPKKEEAPKKKASKK
jgi:hypothetical protein